MSEEAAGSTFMRVSDEAEPEARADAGISEMVWVGIWELEDVLELNVDVFEMSDGDVFEMSDGDVFEISDVDVLEGVALDALASPGRSSSTFLRGRVLLFPSQRDINETRLTSCRPNNQTGRQTLSHRLPARSGAGNSARQAPAWS